MSRRSEVHDGLRLPEARAFVNERKRVDALQHMGVGKGGRRAKKASLLAPLSRSTTFWCSHPLPRRIRQDLSRRFAMEPATSAAHARRLSVSVNNHGDEDSRGRLDHGARGEATLTKGQLLAGEQRATAGWRSERRGLGDGRLGRAGVCADRRRGVGRLPRHHEPSPRRERTCSTSTGWCVRVQRSASASRSSSTSPAHHGGAGARGDRTWRAGEHRSRASPAMP